MPHQRIATVPTSAHPDSTNNRSVPDQRVGGGLEISMMKPFGSRTHETVCPHRFATGPYHALAPASIAARYVASTSSTQNEISIPGGCACGRTGAKLMPLPATYPASTKASVVSPVFSSMKTPSGFTSPRSSPNTRS